MITFVAPLFLVAGALAALVPLALHLIRRRPPTRSPLPTARFLSEDARSSIRVSRPTDRLLMALRMLLLLLFGAALARPAWVPSPSGTREVVLLDRSAAMRGEWRSAVGEARRTLLAPDGVARGDLVLFDTAAAHIPQGRITAALFDSLANAGPSANPASYAAALRSIEPATRELRGADSVRVTLVSALRWGGWRAGTAALREAAWPGAIRLAPLGPLAGMPFTPREERGEALVIGAGGGGRFVVPALQATTWRATLAATVPAQPAAQVIVALRPTGGALRRHAENGATVIIDAAAGIEDWLPVQGSPRRTTDAGELWFAPDLRVTGASERVELRPKRGARVLASWDDGRPAVVASRVGKGCAVVVGTALEGGELPLSAAFPRVLERMARACEPPADVHAMQPLDAGARAILAGRGPAAVNAASIGAGGGVALGRWLMAGALLVALAETFFAYRRRTA